MRVLLLSLLIACSHAVPCPEKCGGERLYPQGKPPNAVDAEVLALCPAPGGAVSPQKAEVFFAKHVDDPKLAQAMPEGLVGKHREGWLASIWTGPGDKNAFTHVLCGDDWDTGKLGGLHLEARYAQLESQGKVCYDGSGRMGQPCPDGNCKIEYRGAKGWSCAVKTVGGFVQGMDALDMLATGTRAYLTCCLGKGGAIVREGGHYKNKRGQVFQIWCGDRNGSPGIASVYPTDDDGDCGP